jgi:hypothetical protein
LLLHDCGRMTFVVARLTHEGTKARRYQGSDDILTNRPTEAEWFLSCEALCNSVGLRKNKFLRLCFKSSLLIFTCSSTNDKERD